MSQRNHRLIPESGCQEGCRPNRRSTNARSKLGRRRGGSPAYNHALNLHGSGRAHTLSKSDLIPQPRTPSDRFTGCGACRRTGKAGPAGLAWPPGMPGSAELGFAPLGAHPGFVAASGAGDAVGVGAVPVPVGVGWSWCRCFHVSILAYLSRGVKWGRGYFPLPHEVTSLRFSASPSRSRRTRESPLDGHTRTA
jgi:hypothetical protein